MKLGCHVSNNGHEMLVGSVNEAIKYQANCFMVYLGAPQNSFRKPMNEWNIEQFLKILKDNKINNEDVIVHAPYIVNLAQQNEDKRKFAVDFITSEVLGVEAIKGKYIVVHPGAHLGVGIEEGCKIIAKSLKEILNNTKNTNVHICIETMSGKGTECCSKFNEIRMILDDVNDERLNVCFDTCHTWDSGYDLVNQYDEVFKNFDDIVGLDKIKVIHLNDTKNDLSTHKDRHENIGFGKIGFDTLLKVANDEKFINIPKILETPYIKIGDESFAPYKEEIAMIKKGIFDPLLFSNLK